MIQDLRLDLVKGVSGRGFAEEAGMAEPSSRGTGPEGPPVDEHRNPWVERWQKGIDREESFRQIFCQYSGLVRSFFVKRGFPDAECDDLVQETFLRVLDNLAKFQGNARFETWLFQVTTNVYRNALRRSRTQKRDAVEVSLEEASDPSVPGGGSIREALELPDDGPLGALISKEGLRVLYEALHELPNQMRRCLWLRVRYDLKYREIAEIMHLSIDTVKAHLFQARQVLKGKLGDYFADLNF